MAADAAAQGIRERDADGSIAIVGEEPTAPFPRPALSKKLWTDPDFTYDDAALDTAGSTGATLHLGRRATAVDAGLRRVTDSSGDVHAYEHLLVATGGHPRRIDGLEPGPRVLYFRTLTDYEQLRALAADRPAVTVVGGGWIGTEIAAALHQHGADVTLLHPDDRLGAPRFPDALAATFEGLFTDAGVTVRGGVRVVGGSGDEDGVRLDLEDGSTATADVVVVGLGSEPAGRLDGLDVELADDGSIVVDERLATGVPGVHAAGDVATYPDRILGTTRVEHVDNATTMGRVAGRILAGSDETYDHTPYFYSAVLGHRFEAVGTLDASLETVTDELPDGGDGGRRLVVYYLDDAEVVGVLLWNVEERRDAARAVLAAHERPADASDLGGRIT